MPRSVRPTELPSSERNTAGKAGVWVSAICILIAALSGVLAGSEFLWKKQEAEHALSAIAGILAASSGKDFSSLNPDALEGTLNRIKDQSKLAGVAVFNRQGNLIRGFNTELLSNIINYKAPHDRLLSMRTPPSKDESVLAPAYRWLKNSFGPIVQYRINEDYAEVISYDRHYLHLLSPVIRDNALVGGIYLAAPFSLATVFWSAFLYIGLTLVLLSLCLFGLAYVWHRRMFALPLQTYTDSLAEIVSNELPFSPLPVMVHPAVNRLTELFNNLVEDNRRYSEKLAESIKNSSVQDALAKEQISKLTLRNEELQSSLNRALSGKHEAELANQRKAEFLASMSHELRTPMTAVLGMADFLWYSDLKPDQRGSIEVMKQTSSMLISIVDDIIDFAKIESGHLTLAPNDFNCHELLNDSFQLLALEAKSKNLKYSLEIACRLPLSVDRRCE